MLGQLAANSLSLLLALSGCLILGAFILNDLPLKSRPGLLIRLKTYLTCNLAETRANALFPELEIRHYQLTPAMLFPRIEQAIEVLGWQIAVADEQEHRFHAIAESRLFRFKDDIHIAVQIGAQGTELKIRAKSRVGSGDLGANTRHIMNLHTLLSRQM